jgi:hypothetical protein
MTVTLALLEDELTLYCIDGGLAVSADFHIGQGSQSQVATQTWIVRIL